MQGRLERVFREYGLPEVIRSDNGSPFASVGLGGLSKLAVWWVKLGIVPSSRATRSRTGAVARTLKGEVQSAPPEPERAAGGL